jgi:hypothetical protein
VAYSVNLGSCAVNIGWIPPRGGGVVGLSKVLDHRQLLGRSWRRMHLRLCVPGVPECLHPSGCQLPLSLLEGTSGWRGLFDNLVRPELLNVQGEGSSQ